MGLAEVGAIVARAKPEGLDGRVVLTTALRVLLGPVFCDLVGCAGGAVDGRIPVDLTRVRPVVIVDVFPAACVGALAGGGLAVVSGSAVVGVNAMTSILSCR